METHNIKYNHVKMVEIIDIFLYFSGSFKYGGIKYKYKIPSNADKFKSPVKKVLLKPPPKIGKIFCISKFLKFAMKIIKILINAIGSIIKFTFKDMLNPNLLEIHEPITNSSIKKITGVIWKYTSPRASQKFRNSMLELTIK